MGIKLESKQFNFEEARKVQSRLSLVKIESNVGSQPLQNNISTFEKKYKVIDLLDSDDEEQS